MSDDEKVRAALAQKAARAVQEARLCDLEAAYVNGSPHEIEMARSAHLAATEALQDRIAEGVFASLRSAGIDPITRRLMRK